MAQRGFVESQLFPVLMMALLGVCVVMLAALTYRTAAAPPLRPPAFEYMDPAPTIEDNVVCPGDTLEWTVGLRVTGAPASVITYRSVWDMAGQFTRVWDSAPDVLNVIENGEVIERILYRVPPLPPGDYQLRTVSQTYTSEATQYVVGFSVPSMC